MPKKGSNDQVFKARQVLNLNPVPFRRIGTAL